LSFNWSSQALFILRATKDVWLPVNLIREWQHSPLEGLMIKVVSELLTQSKRLIKWVIFAIVGLVIFCIGYSCLQRQLKSYKTSEAMVTLGLLCLKNKKGGIVRASSGNLPV
jgi:hypothetical protein